MLILELPVVLAFDLGVVEGVIFVTGHLVDVVGCLVVKFHEMEETHQRAVVTISWHLLKFCYVRGIPKLVEGTPLKFFNGLDVVFVEREQLFTCMLELLFFCCHPVVVVVVVLVLLMASWSVRVHFLRGSVCNF